MRLKGYDSFVVCNPKIAKIIQKKIGLPSSRFILEPEGRDTAAAVGWALARKAKGYDFVAVLSADQYIPHPNRFVRTLKRIESETRVFPDALFVVGSNRKTKKEDSFSQFGWIVPRSSATTSKAIRLFVEKPKEGRLRAVLKGNGLINAGMFFGRSEVFIRAYEMLYPQIFRVSRARDYSQLERLPIDRAICEKYAQMRVIAADFEWEDLGTWADWASERPELWEGYNFIDTQSLKSVKVYGLRDLCLVERAGKLLIMPLAETRNLKKYLDNES